MKTCYRHCSQWLSVCNVLEIYISLNNCGFSLATQLEKNRSTAQASIWNLFVAGKNLASSFNQLDLPGFQLGLPTTSPFDQPS